MVGPAAKREGVAHLQAVIGAAGLLRSINADRKMIRYRIMPAPGLAELRTQLRDP